MGRLLSGVDARTWWCRDSVHHSLKVWCIDTVDAASCGFAGLRAALLGLFLVRGNATYMNVLVMT